MSIINNIIVMTRGDTLEFTPIAEALSPYADYRLIGDDAVYFGLMDPGQYFENALIRKKFDATDLQSLADLLITLEPDETLDLLPGKYFYSIKLHLNHQELASGKYINKVVTLINKTKFILQD